MARRKINRLLPLSVARLKKPGMHADGEGLYLHISPSGSRSWIFRYKIKGRPREMGLGRAGDLPGAIDLVEARRLAGVARDDKRAGNDPIAARDGRVAANKADAAKQVTFRDCAKAFIKSHGPAWRNEKHSAQWSATLDRYAYPIIGDLAVASVDTGLVMQILEPIWTTKTETADRVRGRIEKVLDWAKTRGHRTGENPCRWRDHLSNLLPARRKVQRPTHHPSLPYAGVGNFTLELDKQTGTAALAFKFLILTAARTSEVIGARWSEINLKEKVWTIPGERIKAGRQHRVPLSPQALAILEAVKGLDKEFVFPTPKGNGGLSNGAFLRILDRMGKTDLTPHGFRSSFRNWCAEQTAFPREVAEMALAHVVSDKTEAAYMHSDLFKKRRKLMETWGTYATAPRRGDNVVPMSHRAKRL